MDDNGNIVDPDGQSTKSAKQPESFDVSICIEKIECYLLKNCFFVVGFDNGKSKFRVLKLDRRSLDIKVVDDGQRLLSYQEYDEYRRKEGFALGSRDVEATASAHGIVGMVRFLEGYYLILIEKRKRVAMIGRHCVYRIEDTRMLYVPNQKHCNSNEPLYRSTFCNVDLGSNFYFSYSYDLSSTLQCNMTSFQPCPSDYFKYYGHGSSKSTWDLSADFLASCKAKVHDDNLVVIKPRMKFVWNEHLLSPLVANVHRDFLLYICHGFVDQAFLPISGFKLTITLIARRSKQYAGTRYFKRGVNCEGFPANEVETEQIVQDADVASFRIGRFSSFVQMRGSVPTYWSQQATHKITKPKPQISIDLKDPFYEAAGKHFNNLLFDYGSPVIVLNLVKRKEKRPQEGILFDEFKTAIEYLNQFIPSAHQIQLIGFDMARTNKIKDQNVISHLSEIALVVLRETGFFVCRKMAISRERGSPKTSGRDPFMQTGIVRVNCVDCLDRTNTAQFAIGRIALAHQLFAFGAIAQPELPFDTATVRLLEMLYDDHGDTLALQYGGSQLVHRIKSYRKTAPLTAYSKDRMQSFSRYYSNTFSDADKQNAMNLFLGIYARKPPGSAEPVWSMNGDYTLHHNFVQQSSTAKSLNSEAQFTNRTRYTKWWQDEVTMCLPRAARQYFSDGNAIFTKRFTEYDWFSTAHRLNSFSCLTELFLFSMFQKQTYLKSIKKGDIELRQQKMRPNEDDKEDSESSELSDDAMGFVLNFDPNGQVVTCKIRQTCSQSEEVFVKFKPRSVQMEFLPNHLACTDAKRQYYSDWMKLANLKLPYQHRLCDTYGLNGLSKPNCNRKDESQLYTQYLSCFGTENGEDFALLHGG